MRRSTTPTITTPCLCLKHVTHNSTYIPHTHTHLHDTVGDDVADWARVQKVVHNEPDIAKARQLTDEATEFRSNFIWIAITDCCKACETWKKCFNLVPRHALSLSFIGWFGSFVVWGFSDALIGTGSSMCG